MVVNQIQVTANIKKVSFHFPYLHKYAPGVNPERSLKMISVLIHETLADVSELHLGAHVPPTGVSSPGVKVPPSRVQTVQGLVSQCQTEGAEVQVLGDVRRVVDILHQTRGYHYSEKWMGKMLDCSFLG